MAAYQLTDTDTVIRTYDGAFIPNDPLNADRKEYEAWLLVPGNVPDPYVEPTPPPPEVTTEQQLFYDHENRIRVLEGQPPLTLEDVVNYLRTKQDA